jgi:two-component system nitrogen regulation sensor histidine kinase NtrY
VNRLRNRLILVFLAATLAPLGATLWVTTTLLKWNPNYSAVSQLDELARSLRRTGQEFYQRAGADLKQEAEAGQASPTKYAEPSRAKWPDSVKTFAESNESERFVTAGDGGNTLEYLTRNGPEIWVYSMPLGDVRMDQLKREILDAGALSEAVKERDLQRGFLLTYILLAASFWVVSLAVLVFLAHRISRPIQSLTAGLTQVAAGDLNTRVPATRDDEVGRAIQAFNGMAARLRATTEHLVTMGQLESLQLLARKMAHEVKNSLTPIRLTVEEMIARYDEADRPFMEQAAQIVVDEIETLERRVRAFSQFAAEPPVRPQNVDVNGLLRERVAFLGTAHPEVTYECRFEGTAEKAAGGKPAAESATTKPLPPLPKERAGAVVGRHSVGPADRPGNRPARDVDQRADARHRAMPPAADAIQPNTSVAEPSACTQSPALEAFVDLDLLKGILTNLLENAAEAAGDGGRILAASFLDNGRVAIEVHDSGPGLSEQARASLFQPTISFKKRGMGLGLSIARRSALLSGGDIVLVKGELGGAAFRVLLPKAE